MWHLLVYEVDDLSDLPGRILSVIPEITIRFWYQSSMNSYYITRLHVSPSIGAHLFSFTGHPFSKENLLDEVPRLLTIASTIESSFSALSVPQHERAPRGSKSISW